MDGQDPGHTVGVIGSLEESVTDHAIVMLDSDGRVTTWNDGARRTTGYLADEIVGEDFRRFFTDRDQAAGAPAAALGAALSEGRFECDGWRVRKDGGQFWAHVIVEPLWTSKNRLAGFAVITGDLTGREAAADSLRRTEEEFRRLVQGVTDYAIYMIDLSGRVISWNAGAQRIKGYRPEEIIGQPFARFYTADDQKAGGPAEALATARREGRFEKEGWRVRKDGSQFWAHVVIDPIRDDNGKLIGFAKITQDITERKQAQEALEQARHALFQSQKLDAIGQLTGGVAHDFNNLLMAIIGSLELIRKRLPEDPRITPLIDNAMMGAERGAVLTQRMLTFARKQTLELRPVEVPALVRGLTDLIERSLGPTIRIQTRFDDPLVPVSTDPNQLETALVNLTLNARDAMPEGGDITIAARAETVELGSISGMAPGNYVCLSVTDTGEGMDELTLARATEPFFTTKDVGKGTGLGLSMAHGLVEQSGGRLAVRSRPGEGTVVDLWLPEASPLAQAAPPKPVPERPGSVRPLVVLAVDDDTLVLINAAAMLEDLGHRALTAMSAQGALAVLDDEDVDLVVTDYAMPQVNGLQLAAAIARKRPGLPVILATGYAELPAGIGPALPRLSKPYLQSDLAKAVAQAAAGRGR